MQSISVRRFQNVLFGKAFYGPLCRFYHKQSF